MQEQASSPNFDCPNPQDDGHEGKSLKQRRHCDDHSTLVAYSDCHVEVVEVCTISNLLSRARLRKQSLCCVNELKVKYWRIGWVWLHNSH